MTTASLPADVFTIRAALGSKRPDGNVSCPVPGHGRGRGDQHPSLSVDPGPDGRPLVKCHGGCTQDEVITELKRRGLWPASRQILRAVARADANRIVATYDYTDRDDQLLYQAVRYEPKDFRQRRPDAHGGWIWSLGDTPRVLYRLPRVLEAVAAGTTIYVVEGEKDVEAIERAGGVATCNAMGAGAWTGDYERHPEYRAYADALKGAHVVVVADRDKVGLDHARAVTAALDGVAASIRVVEAREGKDAADHLGAGHGLDDFEALDLEGAEHSLPNALDDDVARELHALRVRDQARRLFATEQRADTEWPEVLTLAERLARPLPPIVNRIEGWQPLDSRVLLAAQYKSGKTTLRDNLARCLVDGAHFLGVAAVTPVTGTVAIFDAEMAPRMLDEWLADQSILHPEKVIVVPLRGRLGTFDILDSGVRTRWAGILRDANAEYVILDCLRPLLDSLGLDENHDAGRLLVAFDALLAEAGVSDACVIHHMGHGQERSRGDSRIRDWPDVEWRLVRENDDPSSQRFITAFGRDVDVYEKALAFDEFSRRLTIAGGSRREAAAREALEAVVALLRETNEPMSGNSIETALKADGVPRADVRDALKAGREDKRIGVSKGKRNANLYQYLASSPDLASTSPARSSDLASSPIERRTQSEVSEGSVRRNGNTPGKPVVVEEVRW